MITLKGFFRKKVTKIYLIIISLLLTAILLLMGFISYFNSKEDAIYREVAKLVVINDKDIYKDLKTIKNIDNISQVFALRYNIEYDIFVKGSYEIWMDGVVIDSYENTEDKLEWDSIYAEGLDNYILVFPDKDYNLSLKDNEIVIGIIEGSYEMYDISYYNDILNKKIGFIHGNDNIEFIINDVIRVEDTLIENSILIISNNLYNKLMEEKKLFVYTANIKSYNGSSKARRDAEKFLSNDKYISFLVTNYTGDSADAINYLFDLTYILELISYLAIIIFLVILFIIFKNIINDSKNNIIINRKIGYNKLQIKIDILKKLLTIYIFSILLSIIIYIILALIINILDINLFLINLISIYKLLSIGFIFILLLSLTKIKLYSNGLGDN